jgi:hypothetical protein
LPVECTYVGRDADVAVSEVIARVAGLIASTVHITLEIEGEILAGGFESRRPRRYWERGRAPKFTNQGFERE